MSAHPQGPYADEALATTPTVVQQALRRDVNERLVMNDGVGAEERVDVMCECVHPDCAARVALTVSEYEAVRRFPNRFLVKAGHEVAEDERVVAVSDGHVVVEKIGRGGLYAVGADPRRRGVRSEA